MKLNIYVVHSRVSENRINSINQLTTMLRKSFDVNLVVVNDNESDIFSPDSIKAVTDFTQIPEEKFSVFNSLISPVHIRHISNLLNHVSCLKRIIESSDVNDFNIVLEDDVVYGDKVVEFLGSTLSSFASTEGAEFAFLGLPSPATESTTLSPFTEFYNVTPVCDSYLVTKKGAEKLLKAMTPMKFQTNVQLSYAIMKADVNAYFARPNIFIDGSKLGVYVSTIDVNNKLLLSNEHANIKALIDAGELDKARTAYESVRFKAHPDNLLLMADLEHKAKNFEKSKSLYDSCFKAYMSSGCVLNNQSNFLKNYIAACKDF